MDENTYTVTLGEGVTLTFARLHMLQVASIHDTPITPEPDVSDEWKKSGLPKEQSNDWKQAMEAWRELCTWQYMVRAIGLSAHKATREGHNKELIARLASEAIADPFKVNPDFSNGQQQLNIGYALTEIADYFGAQRTIFTASNDADELDKLPLARALRWIEINAGAIYDAELVASYRKSIRADGERLSAGTGGGGDKRARKASKGNREANLGHD